MDLSILIKPSNPLSNAYTVTGISVCLIISATCIFLAPFWMPSDYSWAQNVISESAAQGLANAWIARLGFLLFGAAVLLLSFFSRPYWGRISYWFFLVFAACMFGTAAFSHKPWHPELQFDYFEDVLHSITASGMGFAFSFGVLGRLFQREKSSLLYIVSDWTALIAAFGLPLFGSQLPNTAGLVQRTLFVIAYGWFAIEMVCIFRLRK